MMSSRFQYPELLYEAANILFLFESAAKPTKKRHNMLSVMALFVSLKDDLFCTVELDDLDVRVQQVIE